MSAGLIQLLTPRPLKPQEGSSSRGCKGHDSGSAVDVGALLAGAPAVGWAEWCEELTAVTKGFLPGNAGGVDGDKHVICMWQG